MLHDFASDTMASKYAKVFMRAEWLLIGSLFVSALTGLPDSVQGALQSDGDESDSILTREALHGGFHGKPREDQSRNVAVSGSSKFSRSMISTVSFRLVAASTGGL